MPDVTVLYALVLRFLVLATIVLAHPRPAIQNGAEDLVMPVEQEFISRALAVFSHHDKTGFEDPKPMANSLRFVQSDAATTQW
jgi:hypothetical protein